MSNIIKHAWREFLRLSERGQCVLKALKKFDFGHGAWPSIRTLSNLTGYCVRSIQYGIQELKSKGYISIHIRRRWDKSQTSNLYIIHRQKKQNAPLDLLKIVNNDDRANLLKSDEINKLIKDRAAISILDCFAKEIEKKYTLTQLVSALDEYSRQISEGIVIRNPGGWLRCALRGKYQLVNS